jgi:hypothetical protein
MLRSSARIVSSLQLHAQRRLHVRAAPIDDCCLDLSPGYAARIGLYVGKRISRR